MEVHLNKGVASRIPQGGYVLPCYLISQLHSDLLSLCGRNSPIRPSVRYLNPLGTFSDAYSIYVTETKATGSNTRNFPCSEIKPCVDLSTLYLSIVTKGVLILYLRTNASRAAYFQFVALNSMSTKLRHNTTLTQTHRCPTTHPQVCKSDNSC